MATCPLMAITTPAQHMNGEYFLDPNKTLSVQNSAHDTSMAIVYALLWEITNATHMNKYNHMWI